MNVTSVGKLLILAQTSFSLRRFISVRNPLYVRNVGRPSIFTSFMNIAKFILVRNLLKIKNVESPLLF
jgi:hypothetical protein